MLTDTQDIFAIRVRLELLFAVLQYGDEKGTFKAGDRICINQERGALHDHLRHLSQDETIDNCRNYCVPQRIEEKIKFAYQNMQLTNYYCRNTSFYIEP